MKIIQSRTPLSEIKATCHTTYQELVKAVIDIEHKQIALDAEMHADLEKILLEQGSKQEDLWGYNIYPEAPLADMFEFTSFINIRPAQKNPSMTILDQTICALIRTSTLELIDVSA